MVISLTKRKIRIDLTNLCIVIFFCYDLFTAVFNTIFKNHLFTNVLFLILLYGMVILAFSKRRGIIKRDAVLLIIFVAVFFGITYILHPEYSQAMFDDEAYNIFSMIFNFRGSIFAYLFIRMEQNPKKIIEDLKIVAFVMFFLYLYKSLAVTSFESISRISGNVLVKNYNQAYGYKILLPLCFFTREVLKCRKERYIPYVVVSLLLIFYIAARTALLSYLLYISLLVLFEIEGKNNIGKKVLFASGLIIGGIFFTSTIFLNWLTNITNKFNISTKIIDAFISGSSLDGGRAMMWASSIELIKSNPWGYGAYADNYYFYIYNHNFFLEILLVFGCMVGLVILIYIIHAIVYMLTATDKEWKSIFILFFSLWSIRLMFSYTFWYDINFWASMGVYFSYRKFKRSNNSALLR